MEWRAISGYFDPELVRTQVPDNVRLALFEFKEAETLEATVRIRRYYGWLSYIWAELADDIWKGKAALVCGRCGGVISRERHGRRKKFCSEQENPECYKGRKAQYMATTRRRYS